MQSGKVQVQEVIALAADDQNPNFHLVNEPSQMSQHEVLQSWLISTVYHLLVKNN